MKLTKLILSILGGIVCFAAGTFAERQPVWAQLEDNTMQPANIEDIITFLDSVVSASQKRTCREVRLTVAGISPQIKLNAARAIASIDELSVSDEALERVEELSTQIAQAAVDCKSLLDAHKEVAMRASALKAETSSQVLLNP
ncbi:MAG: hypothetical protein FWC40_07915 [Proteobacteria bacterium]|nr:hypothetical protein [Pseudomonadota bacterium]